MAYGDFTRGRRGMFNDCIVAIVQSENNVNR